MAKNECQIKRCSNLLGPGAAKVGYTKTNGHKSELKACSEHAQLLMMSEPGLWRITDDRELKAIPAKRIII